EARRREQELPMEIARRRLHGARPGATPRRIDNPVCDFPVAFAIELEVLAIACRGDEAERLAIERRVNRLRWGGRRWSGCAPGRFGDQAAGNRADPDDKYRDRTVARELDGAGD